MNRIIRILPDRLIIPFATLFAASVPMITLWFLGAPRFFTDGAKPTGIVQTEILADDLEDPIPPKQTSQEESLGDPPSLSKAARAVLLTGFPEAKDDALPDGNSLWAPSGEDENTGPELPDPLLLTKKPMEIISPSPAKAPLRDVRFPRLVVPPGGESEISPMPFTEVTESSPAEPSLPEQAAEDSTAETELPISPDPAAQSSIPPDPLPPPVEQPELVYPSTASLFGRPTLNAPIAIRSEQLEAIARQADQRIRHGFELAGRKAHCAARSEFITALRLVAQGLDTSGRTTKHGKALAAGCTALKEAEDFLPRGAKLEADLDLPTIIGGHTTPVLKDKDTAEMAPLAAMKAYFSFAQEQLAEAGGNEVAGSMALHALGKLHEALAKKKTMGLQTAGTKAVVFYQAALLVSPQNFMTANDLGVLLAKSGNCVDARALLEHSAVLCRQATVWKNLAVVYQRLGRAQLAQRARQQARLTEQSEKSQQQSRAVASNGAVRWVDASAFGRYAQRVNPPLPIPPTPRVAAPPPAPQPTLRSVRTYPLLTSPHPRSPRARPLPGNVPSPENNPQSPMTGRLPRRTWK